MAIVGGEMHHLIMLQGLGIIIIMLRPRDDTPAPNSGANRRGRSRARGTLRSASPGVRSNTSNDNKGKGKGKFDSKKMGCIYFNHVKGSCLKADRCTFSHDPSTPVYIPK